MDQSIEVFNWARIALNEQTPWFLVEVTFRTVVMIFLGLFFIRLLGRKAVTQFSAFEFLLVVMWGTVLGDPTFYEDVALLWTLVVLTTTTIFYRGINYLMVRHQPLEDFIEGKPILVIRDGILDRDSFAGLVVTIEDINTMLRQNEIRSFGEVEKAYLERSGSLSVFKANNPKPGLPTDPPDSPLVSIYRCGETVNETTFYSSMHDGKTISLNQGDAFPPNPEGKWLKSV